MKEYNIISDIAGEYDALMELVEKMPNGETIGIGDLVDRGEKSKEVVEWFMANGNSLLGNHEHLMIDAYKSICQYDHPTHQPYYEWGTWNYNGGGATLRSFGGWEGVKEETIRWLETRPKYLVLDDILVSHSFIHPDYEVEDVLDLGTHWNDPKCDRSIIWNRKQPKRRPEYKLQIAGHNSQFGLRRFSDEQGDYAICLDDCRNRKLTGIHFPSLEIFQVDV